MPLCMVVVLTSNTLTSFRGTNLTTTWNNAPQQPLTSLDEIKVQYKEIFEGIGTFPGKPYHINTDPSIPPKRLPC